MSPTLIDLFSGAGLFSQGFKSVGFDPILAVELDWHAVETYNRNISDVGICANITDLGGLPAADVVIAGPPCQGFSTLGRRDAADERNSLGTRIPDLAIDAGAVIAVIENVPPFLRSQPWEQMCGRFRDHGFAIDTWVLDAADFGTPQTRTRAFTIASRVGSVRVPNGQNRKVSAQAAFEKIDLNDPLHVWPRPSRLAARRMAAIPFGGDKRDILKVIPDSCPPSWFKLGAQATDVWGRIHPDQPSNTIRCRFQNPSTGRYIHPTEDRVLSLREGARLQGVPDDWHFSGHATSIARQIGNGVPVQLSTAVARSVMDALVATKKFAA